MDFVLPAAVAFVTVAITYYYLMIHVPAEIDKSFSKKAKDRQKIQDYLDEIRDKTNIQQVLLWKSNNGPGLHSMGFQIYITVLYQSYEPPFRSVINDFKNLRVDGPYIKKLVNVYDNDMTAFFIDQADYDLMRLLYAPYGARWTALYNIGEDKVKKEFYYLSIATTEDQSPIAQSEDQELAITVNVNNLREFHKNLTKHWWHRFREKAYI